MDKSLHFHFDEFSYVSIYLTEKKVISLTITVNCDIGYSTKPKLICTDSFLLADGAVKEKEGKNRAELEKYPDKDSALCWPV